MTDERLPTDAVRTRYTQEIFTDQYLNDPIRFTPDSRFIPETALRQIDSASVVQRDPNEYAVVNINASGSINYPITLISQLYRRADVERAIDKTFKHFV